jgi:hypothetical protein
MEPILYLKQQAGTEIFYKEGKSEDRNRSSQ